MLKQRIISAIILIPITIALLFYLSPAPFCLLISLMTLIAAWEWSRLMGLKKIKPRIFYLITLAFLLFGALYVHVFWMFIIAFLWWLYAAYLVMFYPRGSEWFSQNIIWRGIMGVIVLIPCWAGVNYIRSQENGAYVLLFLFVLIWGADSAAYFTGKKWGKHKLLPLVSPGKTREGVIGAFVFTLLLIMITLLLCQTPLAIWPYGLLLGFVTVFFSIIGDLFESLMKRQKNLKDSGNFIPGHGGLLDRIDSLTAAAPIFALGALLLGTYLA